MSHDDMYLTATVRTDEERRADWSKVYRLEPDWVPVVARLVALEDERVHLLALVHKQDNTISQLRDDLKRAAA